MIKTKPKYNVYHRKCYRADLEGKEIAEGSSIQDVKSRVVKHIEKHNIKDYSGLKIYYLDTISGDIEVDNNLSIYFNL